MPASAPSAIVVKESELNKATVPEKTGEVV